ncbi:MAG: acetate/propionate family kinase [Prolixibacteraceae bacterium]|jgi:acetate kinase|nr:acetate/propionate family kinase [Prolixibacteraceae bacterium]
MKTANSYILTINGGSSSIKFTFYKTGEIPTRLLHGIIDRIGLKDSTLTFSNEKEEKQGTVKVEASDHRSASNFLMDWLEKQIDFSLICGIGHRVVHGMHHTSPEIITPELLDELHSITSYDPDHLPAEIELIEVFSQRHPKLPQVACFDTAFHSTMPRVAKLLPIPRRFDTKGIQRYGFHGISYAYLMEELARVAGVKTAQGRVILAHLGSGASMAAVHKGKSIDTSMGFTPAGGMMMGTRPGDLDPGVAWYIMKSEKLSPKQFNMLINHESGLLGISETSSDMQDLLGSQKDDFRAAEAVELFCYQAKKCIGAFAAVLGGVDVLVFSGGMGENAPGIRARICDGLEYLGIEIDEKRNEANDLLVSTDKSITIVHVIHTDEEWMIAKTVSQMINLTQK